MYTQPRSSTSDAFAILLLIVGFISFCRSFFGGKKIDLNNIEIFREYPTESYRTSETYYKPVVFKPSKINNKKPKQTSTARQTRPSQTVDNNAGLKNDCVQALMSLGSKKKDAQKITNDIFARCSPKTIQEFIQIAYSKP
jgi:hypothetical protein